LQCASPLNVNCGFSNCSLTHDTQGNWHLELMHCECEACEQYCTEFVGDADLQSGYVRQRLLDRHDTRRLDDMLGVDEPASVIAERVPNLVPVLQLRYLLLIADSSLLANHIMRHNDPLLLSPEIDAVTMFEFVFCSFSRTVLFVKTDHGRRALKSLVLDVAEQLDTLFQISVPVDVAQHPEQHTYFCALLLRVVIAYRLMHALMRDCRHEYKTNETVQHLVLMLQLFADTHLDLHLYADAMGGMYSDEALDTPMGSTMFGHAGATDVMSECVFFSPLQRCYPHPLRAVYAGELIDLSCSLSQANIWSSTRSGWASKTSSLLHMLLVKATNKKCMVREFASMMSAEIGRQTSLMVVLLNVLECTLLGAYPGARRRPLWRSRLCTRRSHHWDRFALHTWCAGCHKETRAACPMCPGGTVPTSASTGEHKNHLCPMCAYVKANKHLIFFAIKEFYVFTVRKSGAINCFLEQESGWIEHRTTLLRSLDDARMIVSEIFETRCADRLNEATVREALAQATKHMALLHDCNKPTMMHQSKSLLFWEVLLGKVSRHHALKVVEKFWTGPQEPQDFLLAPATPERRAMPENGGNGSLPPAKTAGPDPADSSGEDDYDEEKQQEFFSGRHVADRVHDFALPMADGPPQFRECDEPLPHLGGKRWCEMFTLADVDLLARFCVRQFGDIMPSLLWHVGMSPQAVEHLQLMMHNSKVREMPDNQLMQQCEELRGGKPFHATEFHLLHYFLRRMSREFSVSTWALDLDQALAQAQALRRRHRIMPWEQLPESATHVYVCRDSCERVFADIIEAADFSERDDALRVDGTALPLRKKIIAARGVTAAYYDHERQAAMCPRDIDSSMCRDLRKKGNQRTMWMPQGSTREQTKENKRTANSIRESLQSVRACHNQPLERISLLGRVLRVGSRAVALCVRCGSVCYWQESCMTTDGITCGREVRFAPRSRFTELKQFVTPATQQVRTHLATQYGSAVIDLRETLTCAPRATNTLADIFTRTRTPVFNDHRAYDRLSLMQARLQLPAASPPPLAIEGATAPKKRKSAPTPTPPVASDMSLLLENLNAADPSDQQQQPVVAATVRNRKRARASDIIDDVEGPATMMAEKHRQRPSNYDEAEWSALSDEEKFFAWQTAGQDYRSALLFVRANNTADREQQLQRIEAGWAKTCEQWRAEHFYEKEMESLRCCDIVARQNARRRTSLHVSALSSSQLDEMRRFLIGLGALPVRYEICCAFCRSVCDPKGQYRALWVMNIDRLLVDPRTNVPLQELGLVRIFLCPLCFKTIAYNLLRSHPMPLASDVFLHIQAQRAKSAEAYLRKKK
jgi:hypothetical protein